MTIPIETAKKFINEIEKNDLKERKAICADGSLYEFVKISRNKWQIVYKGQSFCTTDYDYPVLIGVTPNLDTVMSHKDKCEIVAALENRRRGRMGTDPSKPVKFLTADGLKYLISKDGNFWTFEYLGQFLESAV